MKKVITILLVVALTAAISIGATLAYLTDRDAETNVFTMGNVSIDLSEGFQQGAQLVPGTKIDKNAKITNTGDNDAWVWLSVLLPVEMGPYTAPDNMSASNNVVHWNYPKDNAANIVVKFEADPVELDPDGDGNPHKYYRTALMYNKVLAPEADTGIMLSTVYMDTHVDIAPDGELYWVDNGNTTKLNWNMNDDGIPVIYVSAYAIQAENFETVEAAYAAYNAQWGDNGTEYAPAPVVSEASSVEEVLDIINTNETSYITLAAGTYKMPSINGQKVVSISGTKDTIIDNTLGSYMDNSTISFNGVTIKGSTGYANGNGSDYAALYSPNVTYTNCTFDGPFRIGRDGATFINCTFTNLGNEYVWTYGNDCTFTGCTFESDGKALLIYSDGGNEVSKVTVTDCIFNATASAKAGAIANQACAAIEIHNYGNGVDLTTSGNTIDADFSGEWRIKTYEVGKPQVYVNGVEYTTIAVDGKTMTIDENKNVTVNG